MKKISNDSYRNLKQSSLWNKDRNVSLKSKLRQEKWLRKQQEQKHARQKKKMILEYEMQREQNKSSKIPKKKFLHIDRTCTSCTSKAALIVGCKDSSGKMLPKCSECMQIIGSFELHRIRIDIHRNLLSKTVSCKLLKDINDPEDALVGRKFGEVFKPIWKSNDFKKSTDRNSISRLQLSGRNPFKSSGADRGDLGKADDYNHFRQRSPKDAMHSREYRGRSSERSREEKDESKEWRDSLLALIKHLPFIPIPVPVYYGNLAQDRTMAELMVQLAAPDSILGGRYPRMGPVGLFPQRFMKPNLHRSGGNTNYSRSLILTAC